MSNERTMEFDSDTFESNNSRETVFTGSIRPLLTSAEDQSDDDDNKENRRPGRDSETAHLVLTSAGLEPAVSRSQAYSELAGALNWELALIGWLLSAAAQVRL